jgi:hypothetical protein
VTSQADYTPEEWWLLKETPLRVGAAVMVAAPSGTIGTMHEMVANAHSFVNAAQLFPNNELIVALVTPDDGDAYTPEPEETNDADRHAREERVMTDAIAKCKQVADLLDRKSDSGEAHEYKQWVMAIGGDVASAAEEGGILGIGRKKVSEPEIKMLTEVAEALRYAEYEPPTEG